MIWTNTCAQPCWDKENTQLALVQNLVIIALLLLPLTSVKCAKPLTHRSGPKDDRLDPRNTRVQ